MKFRSGWEFRARGGSFKNPAMLVGIGALVEDLLLSSAFINIGISDVAALRAELSDAMTEDEPDDHKRRLMSLCYKALACIRALEAQVARGSEEVCVLRDALEGC